MLQAEKKARKQEPPQQPWRYRHSHRSTAKGEVVVAVDRSVEQMGESPITLTLGLGLAEKRGLSASGSEARRWRHPRRGVHVAGAFGAAAVAAGHRWVCC